MAEKVKIKVNGRSLVEGVIRETSEEVFVEAETAKVLSSGGGVTIVDAPASFTDSTATDKSDGKK